MGGLSRGEYQCSGVSNKVLSCPRTLFNLMFITSQLPVSEWYNYLNYNTIADAILDRTRGRIDEKG